MSEHERAADLRAESQDRDERLAAEIARSYREAQAKIEREINRAGIAGLLCGLLLGALLGLTLGAWVW